MFWGTVWECGGGFDVEFEGDGFDVTDVEEMGFEGESEVVEGAATNWVT